MNQKNTHNHPENLKLCPFCGGKAVEREIDAGMWEVMCTNRRCGCRTLPAICHEARTSIHEIWNRRTEDRAAAALNEALNTGDGSYKP